MTTPVQVDHLVPLLGSMVTRLLEALIKQAIPAGEDEPEECWPSVHVIIEFDDQAGRTIPPVRLTLEISNKVEFQRDPDDLVCGDTTLN